MGSVFELLKYDKGEKNDPFDWQNDKNLFGEYEEIFGNKLNVSVEFKNTNTSESLKSTLQRIVKISTSLRVFTAFLPLFKLIHATFGWYL